MKYDLPLPFPLNQSYSLLNSGGKSHKYVLFTLTKRKRNMDTAELCESEAVLSSLRLHRPLCPQFP